MTRAPATPGQGRCRLPEQRHLPVVIHHRHAGVEEASSEGHKLGDGPPAGAPGADVQDVESHGFSGVRAGSAGVLEQVQEIPAVPGLHQRLGALAQLVVCQQALAPGDLLRRSDLEPLAGLDGADEVRGVVEVVEGAGVQPGRAPGRTSTFRVPRSR